MAKRDNQRWVTRVVSLLFLLLLGLVLAGGCTADTGQAEGELTESAAQGVYCDCPFKLWCSESVCGSLRCGSGSLGDCCQYTPDTRMEGGPCTSENASGQRYDGVCVNGGCCPGCSAEGKDGAVCAPGTTLGQCGKPGEKCQNCDDAEACTTDTCKESSCVNTPLPDGTTCGNGGSCVRGVCCIGCVNASGSCINATTAASCGRGGAACVSCNDNLPCTANTCVAGACSYPVLPNNTACHNATVCDGDETCQTGVCQAGAPLNCNDNNVCTMDTCSATAGCTRTNIPGSCNDGNACTDNDVCSGGSCTGTPVVCNDQNPCTNDSCDNLQGCVFTPRTDNSPCDDGNSCSTASVCMGGVCVVTQGVNCDDNRQCTQNDCDPTTQACANTPLANDTPCSDDNACTQGDLCLNGGCAAGAPLACDDNDPCTDDTCDPVQGCLHTPNSGGSCNDLNPCTDGDQCSDGNCLPGQNKPCPETECQEAGTCQTSSGLCDNANKPDGTECTGGSCEAGVCTPTPPGGGAGAAGAAGSAGTAGSAGAAGEPGGAGAAGSAGAPSGSGGSGTGGSAAGNVFERDPGGCSCRTAASDGSSRRFGLLALLGALAFGYRRRRSLTDHATR